jgi:hypothetical protein
MTRIEPYQGRIEVGMRFVLEGRAASGRVVAIVLHGDSEPEVRLRFRRGVGQARTSDERVWAGDLRRRVRDVLPWP